MGDAALCLISTVLTTRTALSPSRWGWDKSSRVRVCAGASVYTYCGGMSQCNTVAIHIICVVELLMPFCICKHMQYVSVITLHGFCLFFLHTFALYLLFLVVCMDVCAQRAGWDDGCLSMKVGEKARFTLSADKAYGKSGFPAWGYPFITLLI